MTINITRYLCEFGTPFTEADKQAIRDEYINALTNVVITNETTYPGDGSCFFAFELTCDENDLSEGTWQ